MNVYQQVTRTAFENGAVAARRNDMQGSWGPDDVDRNPHLLRALSALDGCRAQDVASKVLSGMADELHDRAQADRSAPDWRDLALAMGDLRNAAAAVWRVR